MRELNARLRVNGMTDHDARQLPVHLDGNMLAAVDISTWMTDAGGFDVLPGLIGADGLLMPHEDLAERQTIIRGAGFTIRAVALEDIINAKEQAGRPKDHEALPELRALRYNRTTGGSPGSPGSPDVGRYSGAPSTSPDSLAAISASRPLAAKPAPVACLSPSPRLVRLGYPPVIVLKRERPAYLAALQKADGIDHAPLGERLAERCTTTRTASSCPTWQARHGWCRVAALETEESASRPTGKPRNEGG